MTEKTSLSCAVVTIYVRMLRFSSPKINLNTVLSKTFAVGVE